MATKTVKSADGRWITIDTETGREIKPFEGNLKFVKDAADAVGLTSLPGNLPKMFQRLGQDLYNLPGDIGPNLVYGDEVDSKGRPMTLAQIANRNQAYERFMRGGKGGIYDRDKPSQTTTTTTGVVNAFGQSFDMSDPKQKAAYDKLQAEELKAERNKGLGLSNAAGGGGLKPGQKPGGERFGRGDTRVIPGGGEQTGSSLSAPAMTMEEANKLLTGGYKIVNPFSSTQLPATSQSPYSNVGPVSDGEKYAEMLEMHKPGAVKGIGPVSDGEIYAKNLESGKNTAIKPSDTEKSELERGYKPDLARRRAFLDAESSLQGLRRAESLQGLVYAGGQHHIVNPNKGKEGESDFVSITDKDDVRGYKSGRLSAQDIRDKYVKSITESNSTKYDPSTVTKTGGPVADADEYGAFLNLQKEEDGISGIGPIVDGDKYMKQVKTGRR